MYLPLSRVPERSVRQFSGFPNINSLRLLFVHRFAPSLLARIAIPSVVGLGAPLYHSLNPFPVLRDYAASEGQTMSPSLTEQGANRGAKARRGPLSWYVVLAQNAFGRSWS